MRLGVNVDDIVQRLNGVLTELELLVGASDFRVGLPGWIVGEERSGCA